MGVVLTSEQRERVLANLPLVEHIVNRVASRMPASHSRDDLVQAGTIGLIGAAVRYRADQGTPFGVFAGRRIEGEIIDQLRRSDWAPRSVRHLQRRLATAEDGRGPAGLPSRDQLSETLGLDPGQIDQLRRDIAQAQLDSLDRPVVDDGHSVPLSSTLVDTDRAPDDRLDDQELLGYLRSGIRLLPERHRFVIVGYFFEGLPMTEIGAALGVTQSRASQIKDEALRMLRAGLDRAYGEAPPPTEPPRGRGTARQRRFGELLVSSQDWRQRMDQGEGICLPG